ncbi:aldehyde dehydrogenase family protein, partial [Shewanella algae]|uniref:aldehyde dehydrogenase family protein n=1 Tax=Shewanella algae TaxID=38313 RepID=UPI00313C084B
SKFRNTGQTCVCANRIFVHDAIHDAFAAKLAARVATYRVGPGLDGPTDQGPLIDGRAVAKVAAHVADALEHGARLLTGGAPLPQGERFF